MTPTALLAIIALGVFFGNLVSAFLLYLLFEGPKGPEGHDG